MNRWLLLLLYLPLATLSFSPLTSVRCGGRRLKYFCAVFFPRSRNVCSHCTISIEQCFNGTVGISNFVTQKPDSHSNVEWTARSMYAQAQCIDKIDDSKWTVRPRKLREQMATLANIASRISRNTLAIRWCTDLRTSKIDWKKKKINAVQMAVHTLSSSSACNESYWKSNSIDGAKCTTTRSLITRFSSSRIFLLGFYNLH